MFEFIDRALGRLLPKTVGDVLAKYGGDKKAIGLAVQKQELNPTLGVMAGMAIDSIMAKSLMEMQGFTDPTVAQETFTPKQLAPQSAPKTMMASDQQPAVMGAKSGGLASIPVRSSMYEMAGGGIVAFASGGITSLPPGTRGPGGVGDWVAVLEEKGIPRNRALTVIKEAQDVVAKNPGMSFRAALARLGIPGLMYGLAEGLNATERGGRTVTGETPGYDYPTEEVVSGVEAGAAGPYKDTTLFEGAVNTLQDAGKAAFKAIAPTGYMSEDEKQAQAQAQAQGTPSSPMAGADMTSIPATAATSAAASAAAAKKPKLGTQQTDINPNLDNKIAPTPAELIAERMRLYGVDPSIEARRKALETPDSDMDRYLTALRLFSAGEEMRTKGTTGQLSEFTKDRLAKQAAEQQRRLAAAGLEGEEYKTRVQATNAIFGEQAAQKAREDQAALAREQMRSTEKIAFSSQALQRETNQANRDLKTTLQNIENKKDARELLRKIEKDFLENIDKKISDLQQGKVVYGSKDIEGDIKKLMVERERGLRDIEIQRQALLGGFRMVSAD